MCDGECIQLVYLLLSLMKTAFLCTIFIGGAICCLTKIANRLLVLLEGDYIVMAR